MTKVDRLQRVKIDRVAEWRKENHAPRYGWVVRGPAGSAAFLAGPITTVSASIRQITAGGEFAEAMVDGIPWIGWDVGVHMHSPTREHFSRHESCWANDQHPCWHDGSALAADQMLKRWIESGLDDSVIWPELEYWYSQYSGPEE